MSRIAQASIDAVVAAVDMVELVSGRTQLRRSGREWSGRCPFHEERTPSFTVSPADKVYYCFGCQRGGDAIGFVRETENLDFVGAVEWLADRVGVRLEYEETSPEQDRRRRERDRLLALLDAAAEFYARYLWESGEGKPAREYLSGRGIGEEAARAFRLGYAPAAGDRVGTAALARGFTAAELGAAGLTLRGRGTDRFRARTMFPLADARGRVVGFGARQMPGGDPPKYLNSPEGPVFQKSGILYGLDRARAAIARAGRAVVVEGYTDVIALHAAGMAEAVAAMGTALTERHVGELRRLCETVVLAFDADAAGQEAAVRGMELAAAAGLEVRVATLPDGRDPADVVGDGGADAFAAVLDRAESLLAHRVGRALAAGGSRDRVYARARAILSAAPQSPERADQVRRVADRLRLTSDLEAGLVTTPPRRGRRDDGAADDWAARRSRLSPREREDRLFLGLCLAHPELGRDLISALDLSHFASAPHWEAATRIGRRLAGDETSAEETGTWASRIAELRALAAQQGDSRAVLHELFLKLQLRKVDDALKAARETADLTLSEQQRLRRLQDERLSILEALRAVSPEQ